MIYVTWEETDEYGHQDLQQIYIGPPGIDVAQLIRDRNAVKDKRFKELCAASGVTWGNVAIGEQLDKEFGTVDTMLAKHGLTVATDDLVTRVEL